MAKAPQSAKTPNLHTTTVIKQELGPYSWKILSMTLQVLARHLMQVMYDGRIIRVSEGWNRRGQNKCQSQQLKTNPYLMWCLFAQIALHS